MSERLDERTDAWRLRPWVMAAIAAMAGLSFHYLTDHAYADALAPWRQAAATFVAIATLSFIITVERRRWLWAVGFALAWGLIIALVGWFTARYNVQPTIFEWPYLSALLAVMIAAPLFQTIRDEGRRSLPYELLHGHAWADAVIGAAGLTFTGIVFMFAWLVAGLFDLIGIEAIKTLLQKGWFAWLLAGFAFGAAVGLLRERDRLLPMLQRLVRIVFAVLAPPLAVALVLFIASIPFTGLEKLWKSGVPATPLLLLAGAGAILLANTIFAESPESRSPNPVLRWSSLLLVAVVLPMAAIAALSIGIRIEQYGWTPERVWGVIAVAVAIAYGLAGWFAIWRGRLSFDEPLRPLQTALAVGLCGLALLLALPILDFGSISTRSQLARLAAGKVKADQFDWAALAFNFGPAGREALTRIAQTGSGDARKLASKALKSDTAYEVEQATVEEHQADNLDQYIRVIGPDIRLTEQLRRELARRSYCESAKQCVLFRADPNRLILVSASGAPAQLGTQVIDERDLSASSNATSVNSATNNPSAEGIDLARAQIEVREVRLKLVYVNGKAVGDPFE
jgi:hypothetical protein